MPLADSGSSDFQHANGLCQHASMLDIAKSGALIQSAVTCGLEQKLDFLSHPRDGELAQCVHACAHARHAL